LVNEEEEVLTQHQRSWVRKTDHGSLGQIFDRGVHELSHGLAVLGSEEEGGGGRDVVMEGQDLRIRGETGSIRGGSVE
jgi:hypothetical protein